RVTTLYLAPTMLIMALEHDEAGRRDLSSLHTVIMGGAPIPAERLAQAVASWGPVFAQGYGQWEAPQVISLMPAGELAWALDSGRDDLFASCGRPIAFVRVAIMDDRGTLLPPGSEGEVVTAG